MSTVTTTATTGITTWKLDPAHSVAEFKVRHMMIANVKGQFTAISGAITLDPNDVTKSRIEASAVGGAVQQKVRTCGGCGPQGSAVPAADAGAGRGLVGTMGRQLCVWVVSGVARNTGVRGHSDSGQREEGGKVDCVGAESGWRVGRDVRELCDREIRSRAKHAIANSLGDHGAARVGRPGVGGVAQGGPVSDRHAAR